MDVEIEFKEWANSMYGVGEVKMSDGKPLILKAKLHFPKREWVGLTDEEINLIYAEPQTHIGQYAKAIEAKLKEKNGY
jgi:hypothetical protein